MTDPGEDEDEILPEYDILNGAVRGKYAERYARGTNLRELSADPTTTLPRISHRDDARQPPDVPHDDDGG
jgi:hypothetical protein